jgi:hypothetical protein
MCKYATVNLAVYKKVFVVLIKCGNRNMLVEKKSGTFLKNFAAIPPRWMEFCPKLRDQMAA